MTTRWSPPELDEVDFLVIVALSLGKTQEEAGKFAITPEFPSGVSERTVRNRIASKPAAYDRLRERIGLAIHKKEVEFEEITKEKYKEKLGRLRSKGYQVKEKALDSALNGGDLALGVKVADGVEDRDFGKVSQVHKYEGDVNVNHLVWKPQPVRALLQQEKDANDSELLLAALPADVLEGEVIENS